MARQFTSHLPTSKRTGNFGMCGGGGLGGWGNDTSEQARPYKTFYDPSPSQLFTLLPPSPFMVLVRRHFYYRRRLLAAPSSPGSAFRRFRSGRRPRRTPLTATAAATAPTSAPPAAAESAVSGAAGRRRSGSIGLQFLHHEADRRLGGAPLRRREEGGAVCGPTDHAANQEEFGEYK